MKKFFQAKWKEFKTWYAGKPYENNPWDPVVIIGIRRPKLAIVVGDTIKFLKENWKFLTTTLIAIVGLFVAV